MSQRRESLTETVGRRTFLKVVGSAGPAAAVAACSPVSPERIIPYVIPPEDVVPGVATWYATTCGECPSGCGMLVRTREGRAVKVEGNPQHPINRGALCVRGQASLQGLYNPDRLTGPARRRTTHEGTGHSVLEPIPWEQAMPLFVEQLQAVRATRRGRVAIVTPLLTGTLDELVDRWAAAVGAERFRYEAFAYEGMRSANQMSFGRHDLPRYDFRSPDVVISFGADFYETWLSTVEYSRDHLDARRRRTGEGPRFVQIEPRRSLTGSSADEWVAIAPGTEVWMASAMTQTILAEGRAVGVDEDEAGRLLDQLTDHTPDRVAPITGVPADTIRRLARAFSDPARGPGRSLAVGGGIAVSDARSTAAQVAVNLLNYVAGNVDRTVRFAPAETDEGWSRANTYADMRDLAEAMRAGDVGLAILCDVNPVHTLPAVLDFAGALESVPFVVAAGSALNETASLADLVLATPTFLETWGDVAPTAGVRGLMQPVMQPLHDTRPLGDLLLESGRAVGDEVALALNGPARQAPGRMVGLGNVSAPESADFLTLLRDAWAPAALPNTAVDDAVDEAEVGALWDDTLARGGLWESVETEPVVWQGLSEGMLPTPEARTAGRPYTLLVYPSLHFYDGRGANRPWLQEVPDPVMKATWSSWVEASPATAREIGADEGQLVTVETADGALDVTLLVNPHLRDNVLAMPFGQGHTAYGRYANGRGVNPARLLSAEPSPGGGPQWSGTPVAATPRPVFRAVPRLQSTFDQQGRGIAQQIALDDLSNAPTEPIETPISLYPDHAHPDHRWGMAIDLDACNGCNACVAACYAENNVPVLGPEQHRRGRTMSWLRIERFVDPADEAARDQFVPMLCQHCDHAPCETVCPVYATYHTEEGLNAMVYNRCVGTRYCANNCPYKVRRFNWHAAEFVEPLSLQLNPDVSPRPAGVMEKCSFCVQRIHDGHGVARDGGRAVQDGDVTPACAQTCPAQAIVFGDLNDPTSRVSRVSADARAYHVLGELNTRPAVTYLKQVTRS